MEVPSNEKFWGKKELFCKYCGEKLQTDIKYCSEICMEKDSVWNWNDD